MREYKILCGFETWSYLGKMAISPATSGSKMNIVKEENILCAQYFPNLGKRNKHITVFFLSLKRRSGPKTPSHAIDLKFIFLYNK